MAELLVVLVMASNLWMVIYPTWERQEDNKAEGGREKGCGMKGIPDNVVGRSRFRTVERRPQAATIEPSAATVVQSEAVDEKDVTFADETDIGGKQTLENETSHQVPDEELDETFSDSRVSDTAEYDGNEDYGGTPHEASGVTFGGIDLAMRMVKKPKATREERHYVGMVSRGMKGNELLALIERNLDAARRKLNEPMDYYLGSVSTAQAKLAPAVMPKKVSAVLDNSEDLSIHDFV